MTRIRVCVAISSFPAASVQYVYKYIFRSLPANKLKELTHTPSLLTASTIYGKPVNSLMIGNRPVAKLDLPNFLRRLRIVFQTRRLFEQKIDSLLV